jgi:hypothetical protein
MTWSWSSIPVTARFSSRAHEYPEVPAKPAHKVLGAAWELVIMVCI